MLKGNWSAILSHTPEAPDQRTPALEMRLDGDRMALSVVNGRTVLYGPTSLRGIARLMLETADQLEAGGLVADSICFGRRR
jgi:hypothetical protein